MASKKEMDRIEIVRMANGYMLRPAMDFNRSEVIVLQDCYVYTDFQQAADKVREILGVPDQT